MKEWDLLLLGGGLLGRSPFVGGFLLLVAGLVGVGQLLPLGFVFHVAPLDSSGLEKELIS